MTISSSAELIALLDCSFGAGASPNRPKIWIEPLGYNDGSLLASTVDTSGHGSECEDGDKGDTPKNNRSDNGV